MPAEFSEAFVNPYTSGNQDWFNPKKVLNEPVPEPEPVKQPDPVPEPVPEPVKPEPVPEPVKQPEPVPKPEVKPEPPLILGKSKFGNRMFSKKNIFLFLIVLLIVYFLIKKYLIK
jgi:hypothetical protein